LFFEREGREDEEEMKRGSFRRERSV